MVTNGERAAWERDGFFIRRGFASQETARGMLERVVEICRLGTAGALAEGKLVMPEQNLLAGVDDGSPEEQRVSKVFRLHRDSVFNAFISSPSVLGIATDLVGSPVDCFLSQFIFKNPGAWGQPWHQDEYYFPFDRHPQVGFWLAVTEATHDNGCLHVVPGSHREPVHEHVPDRRPNANVGYVEIVDHDMSAAIPVLMEAGDLLVFHSRLMHSSRDNLSEQIRAAMVYHVSEHGTADAWKQSPVNDWLALGDAAQ